MRVFEYLFTAFIDEKVFRFELVLDAPGPDRQWRSVTATHGMPSPGSAELQLGPCGFLNAFNAFFQRNIFRPELELGAPGLDRAEARDNILQHLRYRRRQQVATGIAGGAAFAD